MTFFSQIGYTTSFLGGCSSTADLNVCFNIPKSCTSIQPLDVEMHRTGLFGSVDVTNSEWDKYTLTEVSDKGNIGSATLINGKGDANGAQADGLSGLLCDNRNDWQHDTFRFNFDTSAQAWKDLAIGKSLSVSYRVDAKEFGLFGIQSDCDSLNINFCFTKTCFAADAMIRMADGTEKRADQIVVGDLVATADHGGQPVRWISSNTVLSAEMKHFAQWRPIRIAAGALGNGLPTVDLQVSQLHRVLVSGDVALDLFGAAEVLVPAKFLTAVEGIDVVEAAGDLTYVHFMFDHHEVVWSNGARTESFFVSPLSRSQIGEAQLAELESLFPELGKIARDDMPTPARPFVRGDDALGLAQTHRTRGVALQ